MNMSIPAFHVSDISKADGSGDVFIASRKDAVASGVFQIKLAVHYTPPADEYPVGNLSIHADLSDSARGTFVATSIELINSYGKHNPTLYMTGRCKMDPAAGVQQARGLRYWLMVANNKQAQDPRGTPDVVGFAVHDNTGARIAYGTGPLRAGDIAVAPK